MSKEIKITVGNIVAEGTLNETKTAGLIYNALPIAGVSNLWDA